MDTAELLTDDGPMRIEYRVHYTGGGFAEQAMFLTELGTITLNGAEITDRRATVVLGNYFGCPPERAYDNLERHLEAWFAAQGYDYADFG